MQRFDTIREDRNNTSTIKGKQMIETDFKDITLSEAIEQLQNDDMSAWVGLSGHTIKVNNFDARVLMIEELKLVKKYSRKPKLEASFDGYFVLIREALLAP